MVEQKVDGDFSTPYRFTGKEEDVETGLYYYGARYYDPKLSIWMSVDPLADDPDNVAWSPYTYTWNNPLKFIDPTGMQGESIHEDEDGNVIAEYDDGDYSVYQHTNGTTKADIDQQRKETNHTGVTGNYLGDQKDRLDRRTLNKNYVGHYAGPSNPTTYPDEDGNVKPDFSEPPALLTGYAAVIHDKEYGKLGAEGASGLLTNTNVSVADYRFVINEFKLGNLARMLGDYNTAAKAYGLGVGLGLLALPKTLVKMCSPMGLMQMEMMGEISKIKE